VFTRIYRETQHYPRLSLFYVAAVFSTRHNPRDGDRVFGAISAAEPPRKVYAGKHGVYFVLPFFLFLRVSMRERGFCVLLCLRYLVLARHSPIRSTNPLAFVGDVRGVTHLKQKESRELDARSLLSDVYSFATRRFRKNVASGREETRGKVTWKRSARSCCSFERLDDFKSHVTRPRVLLCPIKHFGANVSPL